MAPAFDGPATDIEEGCDFFIGALHPAEFFEFNDVDLRLRSSHSSILLLEYSQLGAPVQESKAQALQVRMTSESAIRFPRSRGGISRFMLPLPL
jgi:hypothetical protein